MVIKVCYVVCVSNILDVVLNEGVLELAIMGSNRGFLMFLKVYGEVFIVIWKGN